jgi:hypothetical protein
MLMGAIYYSIMREESFWQQQLGKASRYESLLKLNLNIFRFFYVINILSVERFCWTVSSFVICANIFQHPENIHSLG